MKLHSAIHFVLATLALTGLVHAATPGRLIGPDLRPRQVNVQTLREGVLTYFDNQRNLQAEPASRFLQLLFDAPPSASSAAATSGDFPGLVELIDGQRLVGRLVIVVNDGQELRWQHPKLGLVAVPLEQVASLWLRGRPVRQPTPSTDQVELINGDVASGFVEKIIDDHVHLKPDGGAAMLTLPLSSVRALRLANPRREATEQAYALWFADGSRVRCQSLKLQDDQFTLVNPVLAMPELEPLAVSLLRRIDLGESGRKLLDLADLPWSVRDGGEVFGVWMLPRVQAMDLALHAPVSVAWELPSGTRRLTAQVRLAPDTDAPPGSRAWADCRVIVRVDDQIVAEHRLWSQQPLVQINTPIRGSTLLLQLDAATNGPVMDRVLLQEAAVLVGP